jgi:hypothetical protein
MSIINRSHVKPDQTYQLQQTVDKNALIIIHKRVVKIKVSREFSEINNLLHINYNALYQIISVDLLTREDVRIGKSFNWL